MVTWWVFQCNCNCTLVDPAPGVQVHMCKAVSSFSSCWGTIQSKHCYGSYSMLCTIYACRGVWKCIAWLCTGVKGWLHPLLLQFGESQKLRLVRILRSTVMVRVGGGWEPLDEFLQKHDPCRGKTITQVYIDKPLFRYKVVTTNVIRINAIRSSCRI